MEHRRGEISVTVAEKHAEAARLVVRNDYVEIPVLVEIASSDTHRAGTGMRAPVQHEGAVSVIEERADHAAVLVRGHDVGMMVVVEIAGDDVVRPVGVDRIISW